MIPTPPPPFLVETTRLKLLIDSPDPVTWNRLMPSGLFSGITTNPKLLAQAGEPGTVENLTRIAQQAFEHGAGEIHLQVWGLEAEEMTQVGRRLAGIDPKVMVKVPATPAGYQSARVLIGEGVNVTLTAMHSSTQILAAIALGARYAVPYLGRMSDASLDALAEVAAMQEILDFHPGPTRILVASIRELGQVTSLAKHGVSVFTLLPPLAEELLLNPLSVKAAEEFEKNAQASRLNRSDRLA